MSGVTLAYFCYLLSLSMDRDVIDRTGIAGTFDIHLDLSPAEFSLGLPGLSAAALPADSRDASVASDPGGTVIGALRKLGLKLEPVKMRSELLVIDHVEKPSEN